MESSVGLENRIREDHLLRGNRNTGNAVRVVCTVMVVGLIFALTVMRAVMSFTLHMWFAWNQGADDYLLMSQALKGYGSSDNSMTLAKNPGYGYWLRFVSKMGMSADSAYFLIWLLAAVAMSVALWRLFHNLFVMVLTYLYVLWNPLAFENWLGTRLYRNSLIAPLTFIVLGLLILYLQSVVPMRSTRIDTDESASSTCRRTKDQSRLRPWNYLAFVGIGVLTGISMSLLYLLKEDSIWLLPMFVFGVLLKIGLALRNGTGLGEKIVVSILSLMPVLVFLGGVSASVEHNDKRFGVAMLNTRTEGELAGFVSRVYQVDSDAQTTTIWAPPSSIRQVVDASPTLKSEPDLIDHLYHSGFSAPDIDQKPLRADFLTWQIRLAVQNSIGWTNESDIQHFFGRANGEIDKAFKEGKLKKTDKFFLSPNMLPRSPEQIGELFGPSIKAFRWNFNVVSVYNPTTGENQTDADPKNVEGLQKAGINVHDPNPSYFRFFTVERARGVSVALTKIYACLNVGLVLVMLASVALAALRMNKRRSGEGMVILLGILLLVYAFVYGFSVAWFTQFIENDHIKFFYTTGSTAPLVCTALLLTLGAFAANIRKSQTSHMEE